MATTTFSPVNRRLSIIEELEHANACLHAALVRIAGGRTVLRADAPTLFLLSIGIERYLKVAIHILLHQQTGQFADYATMKKKYKHDLLVLQEAVLGLESPTARGNLMSREDLAFVKGDELLGTLLECLDAFARNDRYFMLDGVSGEPMDPNKSPRARWEDILEIASDRNPALFLETERARKVVASRLIGRVQRYLRCISQAVCYSTDDVSRALAHDMRFFLNLKDDELEVPISI